MGCGSDDGAEGPPAPLLDPPRPSWSMLCWESAISRIRLMRLLVCLSVYSSLEQFCGSKGGTHVTGRLLRSSSDLTRSIASFLLLSC